MIWEITKWVHPRKTEQISYIWIRQNACSCGKTRYEHNALFNTKLYRMPLRRMWKLEISYCEHRGEIKSEPGRKRAVMTVTCTFHYRHSCYFLSISFSKFLRRDDKINLNLNLLHALRSLGLFVCLLLNGFVFKFPNRGSSNHCLPF